MGGWDQFAPALVRFVAARPRQILCCWVLVVVLLASNVPLAFENIGNVVDDLRHSKSSNDKRAAHRLFGDAIDFALQPLGIVYFEALGHKDMHAHENVLREARGILQHQLPDGVTAQEPEFSDNGMAAFMRLMALEFSDFDYTGQLLVNDIVPTLRQLDSLVWVGAGGFPVLRQESGLSSCTDIATADAIVLPVGLGVLAYMLRSARLLICPLVTAAAASAMSFGVVGLSGLGLDDFAPLVMSSLVLAMSMDYNLFILTRFSEGMQKGLDVEKAVEEAITYAGHTCVTAGSCLAICLAALLPLPLGLHSIGGAACMAVGVCMAATIGIVPSLLLSFPGFFAVAPAPVEPNRVWQRVARFATHPSTALVTVLLIFAVVWRLGPAAADVRVSGYIFQRFSRKAIAQQTMERFARQPGFNNGIFSPYSIVLQPAEPGESIFTPFFWRDARDTLKQLYALAPALSTVISPMLISGHPWGVGLDPTQFPDEMVVGAFEVCHPTFDGEHVPKVLGPFADGVVPCEPTVRGNFGEGDGEGGDCCDRLFRNLKMFAGNENYASQIKEMLMMTVGSEGTSIRAVVTANLPADGFRSLIFLRNVRATLAATGHRSLVVGEGVDMVDLQGLFAAKEPVLLGSVTAAVLLVLGLWYGSVALPLRSIVTITLTQIACFGAIVGVYEQGYLEFLHVPALGRMEHGLLFPVVPLCFVLVLGFSLDYDVFLVDRIVEFRKAGCSDTQAVQKGVEKTCAIITSAGAVMACAFSGLLLSQMPLLNIIGTALVTAVIVDTLIVRAVVTPTLMTLLGSSNWYPTEMPPVKNEPPKAQEEESRKRTSGGVLALVALLVVVGIAGLAGRLHYHHVALSSPSSLLERPALEQRPEPCHPGMSASDALAMPDCDKASKFARAWGAVHFGEAAYAAYAGSSEASVRPADSRVLVMPDGQMRTGPN